MMGQSNTQEIRRCFVVGKGEVSGCILLMISGPEKSDHPIGL